MRAKLSSTLPILILLVGATQFLNCSSNDSSDFLSGNGSVKPDLTLGESGTYLNPKLDPPRMECTQDHIQIGGVCETNGAEDSYIEYSLTREKNPIPWRVNNENILVLREARCENGRYFLIIPRPDADTLIASNDTARCYSQGCWAEYQINSRMFARPPGTSQYNLVYTAPAMNVSIQLIYFDGTNRTCPK